MYCIRIYRYICIYTEERDGKQPLDRSTDEYLAKLERETERERGAAHFGGRPASVPTDVSPSRISVLEARVPA